MIQAGRVEQSRAEMSRREFLAATGLAGVRRRFHLLGEQGRALRDRLEQIRIRWGARP